MKALDLKLQSEVKQCMDFIEKSHLRKIQRQSLVCSLECIDKASRNATSDEIHHCMKKCQIPLERGQHLIQNEISRFQQRLQRAMVTCQDEANDLVTPDVHSNPDKLRKIENKMGNCFAKTIQEHIGMIGDMKKRIISQLRDGIN